MSGSDVALFLDTYQPPLSLWQLVEQHVPEEEQGEVKSMLGEPLIELSLDLHQEVETMLVIWQDHQASQRQTLLAALPEPPAMRERLVQEICFFVQNVRDKAKIRGLDLDHILSKHNTEVIDYALQTSRSGRSGSSASEASQRSASRCASRVSLESIQPEEVNLMSEQLQVLHIDQVISHLRQSLLNEVHQLEEDIQLLQLYLLEQQDQADGIRPQPALLREPTISELREERTSLEKEWLSQETLPQALPQAATASQPTVIRTLGGKSRLRPIPTDRSSGACRPGPVKASHNLISLSPTSSGGSDVSDQDQSPQSGAGEPLQGQPLNTRRRTHTNYRSGSDSSSGDQSGSDHKIQIRPRTISPTRLKVVPIGSIANPIIPSPPSSAKPKQVRPGSAERFRSLVMDCREGN